MSFIVLGINHQSASIALREKLAIDESQLDSALTSLRAVPGVREAAILSTCNRTELYCMSDESQSQDVLAWLGDFNKVPLIDYSTKAYEFKDAAGVRHLMEVACGLDSMVLGEPQILGQLKKAFAKAQGVKSIGPEMSRLFQHVFATAKQIRTETDLGAHPVSLAYVSLNLAKRIFTDISSSKVMLIGAGEMIELVAKHFYENGINQILVANRTLEKADLIAQQVQGRSIMLQDLHEHLHEVDIVVTSTAAPVPILGKGTVESALKQRKHSPMLMVDLAVPRDIESEVSKLSDAYLYTLDDLQTLINENVKNRESAGEDAKLIIDRRVAEFLSLSKERHAVGTLKAYRGKVEDLRQSEIDKARQSLAKGENIEAVLERFSKDFSNKLMHEPSLALKKAGVEERLDLLEWSKELFGLSANEVSELNNFRRKTDKPLIKTNNNQKKD